MPEQQKRQLVVTYSNVTIDTRTDEKTYWFEANFGPAPTYTYCFGLSEDGAYHTACGAFISLEHEVQEEFIAEGRKLLPKVLS